MKMMMVKLSEVKEVFNPRSDFSKVEEIARSIEKVGLLQPIVVRGQDVAGVVNWILVDGACRVRALKSLGQKETQAVCVDGDADEAQMAANLMRSDLNWLERARGYRRLIQMKASKYSTASIAKIFGEKKAAVERIVAFAEKWDPALDAKLSPMLAVVREDNLKILAQVPKEHQALFMQHFKGDGWNAAEEALAKAFFRLDHSDVFATESAAAAKGGFKISFGYGAPRSYTTDRVLYLKAKAEYEAAKKKKYGSDQKKQEKDAAKTRKAQLTLAKKRRASKAAAQKLVKDAIVRFLKKAPTKDEIQAAGRHAASSMNSESMRAVFASFGVKEKKTVAYGQPGARAFDQVLSGLVTTPEQVVRLHALLSGIKNFGGPSFEEQVVARAGK